MGSGGSSRPNQTIDNGSVSIERKRIWFDFEIILKSSGSTTSSRGTIIVYGMYQSLATQRVLMTLVEKGLKFEFKVVNIQVGEHKVYQIHEIDWF